MFCSRSISTHLIRGLGAVAFVAVAVMFGSDQIWILPPLLIGTFILLRGCPMCWLVGLFETIAAGRSAARGD